MDPLYKQASAGSRASTTQTSEVPHPRTVREELGFVRLVIARVTAAKDPQRTHLRTCDMRDHAMPCCKLINLYRVEILRPRLVLH